MHRLCLFYIRGWRRLFRDCFCYSVVKLLLRCTAYTYSITIQFGAKNLFFLHPKEIKITKVNRCVRVINYESTKEKPDYSRSIWEVTEQVSSVADGDKVYEESNTAAAAKREEELEENAEAADTRGNAVEAKRRGRENYYQRRRLDFSPGVMGGKVPRVN